MSEVTSDFVGFYSRKCKFGSIKEMQFNENVIQDAPACKKMFPFAQ